MTNNARNFANVSRTTAKRGDLIRYSSKTGERVMQVTTNFPGYLAGTVVWAENLSEMQTATLGIVRLLWA